MIVIIVVIGYNSECVGRQDRIERQQGAQQGVRPADRCCDGLPATTAARSNGDAVIRPRVQEQRQRLVGQCCVLKVGP
jgi:hypothetical protein